MSVSPICSRRVSVLRIWDVYKSFFKFSELPAFQSLSLVICHTYVSSSGSTDITWNLTNIHSPLARTVWLVQTTIGSYNIYTLSFDLDTFQHDYRSQQFYSIPTSNREFVLTLSFLLTRYKDSHVFLSLLSIIEGGH